ncbi:phage tail domain-containing protein [Staphylococcus simulans]|uniref:phage tail domain-containing protein n=1 Tax=Staphylococcus simulans TaxID=1286 RepID=UPI001F1FAE0B|nr:phage tail domain-containing protein [Staphylococcus simulans]
MGFTLYDPNMNELKFPVGVKPLDFLLSSISKERITQKIDGIPGEIDYGFNYGTREASMTFWLRHYHAEHDFLLLVSELNDFLDSQPFFYVAHKYLPTRVIKITVDESYQPDRILGSMYAKLEVKCSISGLPFWRTKWKTQELELEGYSADSDKFGFADNINLDYPNYTFTTNSFYVWNGGNLTVDPRNMDLKIRLYQLKTDGNFKLTNHTTGETFEYRAPRTGNTVDLNGIEAFVGMQANRLRETNRKYISLAPGLNKISYTGGEMINIQFDFPFYFK